MGKFDGVMICTDLDGTLLRNNKTISDENIEAIEYFKRNGGIFTFITGRMPFFVSDIYNAVKPNAPFGCINGGGLYDHIKQEYIWTSVMPRDVVALIECIDEKFPQVGIQVNTFHKVYFSKENQVMERFRRITGVPNLIRDYHDVEEPIAKIVFGSESEEEILCLERALRAHPMAVKFDFIRSEQTLFEILPKGIGKGTAITELSRHLGIDINKTLALGDYNNDISMFSAARIGIAVSNACEAALEAADYVTVSNEENAIAQTVRDLEQGKLDISLCN